MEFDGVVIKPFGEKDEWVDAAYFINNSEEQEGEEGEEEEGEAAP